jgi:hypothetical protein
MANNLSNKGYGLGMSYNAHMASIPTLPVDRPKVQASRGGPSDRWLVEQAKEKRAKEKLKGVERRNKALKSILAVGGCVVITFIVVCNNSAISQMFTSLEATDFETMNILTKIWGFVSQIF